MTSFLSSLLGFGKSSQPTAPLASSQPASDEIADLSRRIESVNLAIERGKVPEASTVKELTAAYANIKDAPQDLKEKIDVLQALVSDSIAPSQSGQKKEFTERKESGEKKPPIPYLNRIFELSKEELSAKQAKTAASLLIEVNKIATPSKELLQASNQLQNQLDHFYVAKVIAILNPLQVLDKTGKVLGYAPGKMGRPNMPPVHDAFRLLTEMQTTNPTGSKKFQLYRLELEKLVDGYVDWKYKNPLDTAQALEAAKLFSLIEPTGKINSEKGVESTQVKLKLQTLLNEYASNTLSMFQNRLELELPPIGIPNQGNTCFAASWMQLVANNELLSKVYEGYFPQGHFARDLLDEYHAVQKAAAKNLESSLQPENIIRLREALGGGLRQQDANEFANALHNRMEISSKGKIGNKKFAAKIIEYKTHLKSAQVEERPYSASRTTEYIFPSLELNFDPNDANPSLSSMMDYTHVNQINDRGTHRVSRYFAEVPNIFVYRFARLEGRQLNTTEVDLPFHHEITDTSGQRGVLQLQGFVRHTGNTGGGHYISYLVQNGKFWLINDSKTTEISPANYLLAARHAAAALYSRVE